MIRLAWNLLAVQGAFYIATGIWPLLHLPSFEAVTGPKVDDWLVHTVGLLAAAIGAALLVGWRARRRTPELLLLAGLAALAFAAIDVTYVLAGRLRPIYLADAAAEAVFLAAALVGARASRTRTPA